MKRTSISLAVAAATIAILSIAGAAHAKKAANYKIGDTIADFALKDDQGKTVRLSAFRGKLVVLDFYASWCPGCNEAAPHIEKEVWQKYKNRNVQVLGIAVQEGESPAAKFRKFRKDHAVTYPLLLNESGDILIRFGFDGIPQPIVIDTKGKYVSAPNDVAGVTASLDKLLK
jgi:peroxiredoxin